VNNVVRAGRRKQADRREEAEAKLMHCAIQLIAKKGFDGFRLAEVGEAAGYSRGLPVHYFGTKDNLLICISTYLIQSYYDTLAKQPEATRGLPRLEQMIRHYAATPVTPRLRALGIIIAHARVVPSLYKVIKQLNANGLDRLEEELHAGIEAGNIRADIDCNRIARMIYAYLRGQLTFLVMDSKFGTVAVTEEFITMLSTGLRPPLANAAVKLPRSAGNRANRVHGKAHE
jgi:AcrR family transcriptional regulator